MRLFFSYLRSHRTALLPPVFALIFSAVLFLYDTPLYALTYALMLCVPLYVLALAAGFWRYKKRYALLHRLCHAPSVCGEHMPAPEHALEEAYQSLIASLLQERDALLSQTEARYEERIGYYTLWAHQIKTPIAAMRLQLADRDSGEARALQCELARMEQYVDMALCYLRLDSGSTDYVFENVELAALVRACVRKFAQQFIQKHLRLTIAPISLRVLTDEKWLAFVIEQLLSNAVKYTPSGGEIRIGVQDEATLFIEDTGVGIAAQDLPRIFEQGFTGLNGRSDKRASGVGLYLCRRILQSLGHSIRCESRVGEGTRMQLDLSSRPLDRE